MVARPKRWGTRGAIAALVIAGLLFTGVYPLRRYLDVREQVASLRAESQALDVKAEELRKQAALLRTDAEVERQARDRLNYVRPGETAFSMPHVATPEPTPSIVLAPGQTQAPARPSFVGRWWEAFRYAWGIIK
jgi:cell division protein FtsB